MNVPGATDKYLLKLDISRCRFSWTANFHLNLERTDLGRTTVTGLIRSSYLWSHRVPQPSYIDPSRIRLDLCQLGGGWRNVDDTSIYTDKISEERVTRTTQLWSPDLRRIPVGRGYSTLLEASFIWHIFDAVTCHLSCPAFFSLLRYLKFGDARVIPCEWKIYEHLEWDSSDWSRQGSVRQCYAYVRRSMFPPMLSEIKNISKPFSNVAIVSNPL